MALIKCAECGRDVSDQALACPHCGCPIKQASNSDRNQKKLIYIGSFVIAAITILAIIFLRYVT